MKLTFCKITHLNPAILWVWLGIGRLSLKLVSKYFWLCGPCGLFCSCLISSAVVVGSSHRQYLNEWLWLCSNKILFTERSGGLDLAFRMHDVVCPSPGFDRFIHLCNLNPYQDNRALLLTWKVISCPFLVNPCPHALEATLIQIFSSTYMFCLYLSFM